MLSYAVFQLLTTLIHSVNHWGTTDLGESCTRSWFTHSEVCSVQVQLINDAYNLVIDAMLGPEADHGNIKEPYSGILVTLKQIKTPIVSVDVPSGKCFVHTVEIRPRVSETLHDRWASRHLPRSLGSQAGVFQIWRHTWRINLMQQSAQCELIIPRIHHLLSVSTTSRKWSQPSSP